VLGVSLLVQPVGFLAALGIALALGEAAPDPGALVLASVAGVVGATGLVNLYHGLAVGRMGVVAPMTGLMAAIIPVLAGMIMDGLPAAGVLAGIALGLLAVGLVSRAPGGAGRRTGAEFGLAAGLCIGIFNILVSQVPAEALFGSLAVVKLSAAAFITLVILLGRRAWRVTGSALAMGLGVGVLDFAGNAFFILAAQAGRLDVAAVLSSLYPAGTVVLAAIVLREHISRSHLVGVIAALAAIGLIASGSLAA
jgi:drug/metabolite transporter (DMT)-like permease